MDEGRYGQVRKQEDKHRKFVCVMNDILKTRSDVYENCLTREKYESSFRYVKNVMTVRRSLVRQKVLRRCLDMRRRREDGKRGLYGIYDGVSLHTMSRDVEAYIASKHPRVRRLQKVQRLQKESLENGNILDNETMKCRVKNFLVQRVDKRRGEQNEKFELRPLQQRNSPFKRSLKLHLPSEEQTKMSALKDVIHTTEKPIKPVQDHTDVLVIERRPTLILPPIAPSRALVKTLGH